MTTSPAGNATSLFSLFWSTVLFMILCVSSSMAQGPGSDNFSDRPSARNVRLCLGAGVGIPTGDLGDGWNMGFHGFGALGITVVPGFQILGKIEYHSFGLDDQGLGDAVEGGTFSAIMFGGDGLYKFSTQSSRLSPFLMGGVGVAKAQFSDLRIQDYYDYYTLEIPSETKIYFEFGAGFDIATSETASIFFQGRYVSISTSGSSATFVPLSVGLQF